MQQLKERGVYTLLSEGKEFVAHAVFRGVYVLYEETDRPAPEYCYCSLTFSTQRRVL